MATATECSTVKLSVAKQCEAVPEKYRGIYRQAMTGRRALKAIRAKCLDCTCWQEAEVRRCTIEHCPLWPYRMGRMASSADATADSTPQRTREESANGGNGTYGSSSTF